MKESRSTFEVLRTALRIVPQFRRGLLLFAGGQRHRKKWHDDKQRRFQTSSQHNPSTLIAVLHAKD